MLMNPQAAENSKSTKRFIDLLPWIGVFVLVAVLYLPGLNHGIWTDEYSSIEIAFSDTFQDSLQSYDHPPLYFILLRLWGFVSIAEPMLRGLSILFSISALILLMICLNRSSKMAALLGGVFFVSLPILVRYAQEIRHYGLLLMLLAAAYLLIMKIAEEGRGYIPYLALTLILSLAAATHLIAIFMFTPLLLFWGLQSRDRINRVKALKIMSTFVLPTLTFLYFYLFFLRGADKTSGWWIPEPSIAVAVDVLKRNVGFNAFEYGYTLFAENALILGTYKILLGGVLLLLLAGVVLGNWKKSYPFLLAALLFYLQIVVFSMVHTPILWYRTVIPGLLPLIAFLALQLSTVHIKALRIPIYVSFGALCAGYTLFWMASQAGIPEENWRALSYEIRDVYQEDDVVYFFPSYAKGPVDYYFPLPDENGSAIPLLEGTIATAMTVHAEKNAAAQSVYVVLRQDKTSLKHTEAINSFLDKLVKKFNTHEVKIYDGNLYLWCFTKPDGVN